MKPIVQALLVADHVYTDQQTNKKVVAGIFHRLILHKTVHEVREEGDTKLVRLRVPVGGFSMGSPFCYMSLTELHGEQPFELRYVDLDDDRALFGFKFNVKCDDPLETVEIIVPVPPLPAEKPGTFALELLWNNEHLGSHRINVEALKEKDSSDGD